MKINMKATGNAPTHYEFNGEIVTAFHGGQSEDFDLSGLAGDNQFEGVEPDTLDLPPMQIIRDAYRDGTGELHVTLAQEVGPGHWSASSEFSAPDYDPDAIAVAYQTEKAHAGTPYAVTRRGRVHPTTDEVL